MLVHFTNFMIFLPPLSLPFSLLTLSPDHSGTTSHPSPSAPAKMSPMRLMQWAKMSGKDETMAEVNRKMQRALEEALMKNIHLQQVCNGNFFVFK